MSTILVTGAAGFIGSHTCDQLLAGGHAVIGIDNFRTGKMDNVARARKYPSFRIIEADITDGEILERLANENKLDSIIHLAALVSVQESVENPDLNFRLNVLSTHLVAEAARRNKVGRIVFASSAAVYGDAAQIPVSEDAGMKVISPYGSAKVASEAILQGYASAFGFVVRCQRYFNVYGPRQDPNSPYSGVISIFCNKLLSGHAPTIFGDGEQTRDFISVADVARSNAIAATSPEIGSGTVNICSGRATSINELVRILRSLIPGAMPSVHKDARPSEIRHSLGAPDAASLELGFRAEIDLKSGLKALIDS